MKPSRTLAALAGAVLVLPLAGGVLAQDDESAYVYASYYECTDVPRAVEMLRDGWAPLIQARMDAGDVSAWGVLTHDTGNRWSMAVYHVGEDRDGLNAALDEALAEYRETSADQMTRFREVCPSHEDYIWVTGPGSEEGAATGQGRPGAAMSVYFVCDEGREAVADLIVENVWAPVFDRQVSEGRLNSWGWLSHFIGGKYRRLLVTDAADHATLLDARDRILEESAAESGALASAFSDVCNGHTDILWNIAISRP